MTLSAPFPWFGGKRLVATQGSLFPRESVGEAVPSAG